MTRWGAYVEQRIDDLKHGKGREDWDGEWPAPAIAVAAWDWACRVFPVNAPTPSVVPTCEGELDFVWHKGGWDIELEIGGPHYALAWCRNRATSGEITLDLDYGAERAMFCGLLSHLGAAT